MGDISSNLDCSPQGDYVTKKRVQQFSDRLKPNEKVHYVLPLVRMKIHNEKMDTGSSDLCLLTDRRILILVKPLIKSNKEIELSYTDYELAHNNGYNVFSNKISLNAKSGKDYISITKYELGSQEFENVITFLNNAIDGADLKRGISLNPDVNKTITEKPTNETDNVAEYTEKNPDSKNLDRQEIHKEYNNSNDDKQPADERQAKLDCRPQGEYVTEERVEKFSEKLKLGENVHYLLPIISFKLGDDHKVGGKTHLCLLSDDRILMLIRPLLGRNKIYEYEYREYETASSREGEKITLDTGTSEDNMSIFTNRIDEQELSDAVKFINNNTNISDKPELRRTCKACGNVWHVEKEEIKELEEKRDQNDNNLGVLGAPAAGKMSERNKEDAIQRLKELNKCPECRSSNYTEETVDPEELEKSEKPVSSEENNLRQSKENTHNDEVNYCPHCGEKIKDNASFCHQCGSKIE